jgi:hypothetical protein
MAWVLFRKFGGQPQTSRCRRAAASRPVGQAPSDLNRSLDNLSLMGLTIAARQTVIASVTWTSWTEASIVWVRSPATVSFMLGGKDAVSAGSRSFMRLIGAPAARGVPGRPS